MAIKRLSIKSRCELVKVCISVIIIEQREIGTKKEIKGKINCNYISRQQDRYDKDDLFSSWNISDRNFQKS